MICMKKHAILSLLSLAIVVVISACSKKSDPAPDLASQVAGTYEMTNIRYDSAGTSIYNYALPLTVGTQTLSGSIVARRDSASVIYVTYTIKQTGKSDYNDTFGQLKLQGTIAPYDIYYNTTKVGTTDGKTLTIDFSYSDNAGTKYREVYSGQKK